jgi:hypothetical protein
MNLIPVLLLKSMREPMLASGSFYHEEAGLIECSETIQFVGDAAPAGQKEPVG